MQSDWDNDEKELVLKHLKENSIVQVSWMGLSWCRFRCGESAMGSSCLTDGKYIFPEQFHHYIERHSVKPPQEFINHVLSYNHVKLSADDFAKLPSDNSWWKSQTGFNNYPSTLSYLTVDNEAKRRYEERVKKGYIK